MKNHFDVLDDDVGVVKILIFAFSTLASNRNRQNFSCLSTGNLSTFFSELSRQLSTFIHLMNQKQFVRTVSKNIISMHTANQTTNDSFLISSFSTSNLHSSSLVNFAMANFRWGSWIRWIHQTDSHIASLQITNQKRGEKQHSRKLSNQIDKLIIIISSIEWIFLECFETSCAGGRCCEEGL